MLKELEKPAEKVTNILLDPNRYNPDHLDARSREIMQKTIAFFEQKGKTKLKEDDRHYVWYTDFLDFIRDNEVFADLLTPPDYGGEYSRWDTRRNCDFSEITGFYGLHYWYTWQVTILGLGPIWMGQNEPVKQNTAKMMRNGDVFAFGLSEREHGADIYSTDLILTPQEDGTYLASGEKYYIGNANVAGYVSVFGRFADTNEYVFFVAKSDHENYNLIRNVVNVQSYVAQFELKDYPVREEDILARGQDAWNLALNTINVGKYNLGWASIGICTHSLYEAINHAGNRRLYKMYVTDFPHVQQMFVDAYCRLTAMKLFALRASDYMRTASDEDRRYLLYNPIVKMKVTTEGEKVIDLLWNVIAAKGFESDMYFEMATRDIRALPKLEGTVHVNIALIVKFMQNYFFSPEAHPDIAQQNDPTHDTYLFNQAPTRGLGQIRFHDYGLVFAGNQLPNVQLFRKQIDAFKLFLVKATPSEVQQKDVDYLLALGEIFTLVVYAQLILENADIYNMDDELIDQMFDVFVRDFSAYALQLHSKPSNSETQMEACLKMIARPEPNPERYQAIWQRVHSLKDQYEMPK
ncbi:MAG: acyl-CoA dehydrogenase [Chloroflexota bacterium]